MAYAQTLRSRQITGSMDTVTGKAVTQSKSHRDEMQARGKQHQGNQPTHTTVNKKILIQGRTWGRTLYMYTTQAHTYNYPKDLYIEAFPHC